MRRAADLDVGPAENKKSVQLGRIWCQQGTAIEANLKPDTTGWVAGAQITAEIIGPTENVLTTEVYTARTAAKGMKTVASASGWFTFQVTGLGLSDAGAAVELTTNYTGTQETPI